MTDQPGFQNKIVPTLEVNTERLCDNHFSDLPLLVTTRIRNVEPSNTHRKHEENDYATTPAGELLS